MVLFTESADSLERAVGGVTEGTTISPIFSSVYDDDDDDDSGGSEGAADGLRTVAISARLLASSEVIG